MIQERTIHTYVCDFCGKEETAVKKLSYSPCKLVFEAPDGWKKGRVNHDIDICPMCAMKYPDACRDD